MNFKGRDFDVEFSWFGPLQTHNVCVCVNMKVRERGHWVCLSKQQIQFELIALEIMQKLLCLSIGIISFWVVLIFLRIPFTQSVLVFFSLFVETTLLYVQTITIFDDDEITDHHKRKIMEKYIRNRIRNGYIYFAAK